MITIRSVRAAVREALSIPARRISSAILAAHTMAGVEEAIAAAGAALAHLPPYSRDLDPNRAALGQAKSVTAQSRCCHQRGSMAVQAPAIVMTQGVNAGV
jgi:transposase